MRDFSVELRALAQDASSPSTPPAVATAAYSSIPTKSIPTTVPDSTGTTLTGGVDFVASSDPAAAQPSSYRQTWSIGNGNGLNAIAFQVTSVSETNPAFIFNSLTGTGWDGTSSLRDVTTDKLGEGVVTSKGTTDRFTNLAQTQYQIRNDTIAYAGEVGQIPAIGSSTTQTVAEAWGTTASDFSAFMIDYGSSSLVGAGNLAVNHAMLLMDRLTTLNPEVDGRDNDGDGTVDNEEEQMVPGRINVNTAPDFVLQWALPFANATTFANAVVNYRDDTSAATRGPIRNGIPGVAYVGELYSPLWYAGETAPGTADGGDTQGSGGVRTDFLNPAAAATDGITDDREEQIMIAKWLNQMVTTAQRHVCRLLRGRGLHHR